MIRGYHYCKSITKQNAFTCISRLPLKNTSLLCHNVTINVSLGTHNKIISSQDNAKSRKHKENITQCFHLKGLMTSATMIRVFKPITKANSATYIL